MRLLESGLFHAEDKMGMWIDAGKCLLNMEKGQKTIFLVLILKNSCDHHGRYG